MKPEIVELWVKALRSGEYKQGEGRLKKVVGQESYFCCLGVLCDIYNKETGKGAWVEEGSNIAFKTETDSEYSFLPIGVGGWLGNEEYMNVVLVKGDINLTAIAANDGHGFTFNEIADLLEGKNVEVLMERVRKKIGRV